jgi:hypothetical protein
VVITVAESASNFPHLDQQLREVLTQRVNQALAACHEHLDSSRAVMVGGGD